MGSSFEDLVARVLTVKTDLNFDAWFISYDFLKKIQRSQLNVFTHAFVISFYFFRSPATFSL